MKKKKKKKNEHFLSRWEDILAGFNRVTVAILLPIFGIVECSGISKLELLIEFDWDRVLKFSNSCITSKLYIICTLFNTVISDSLNLYDFYF